jgi:hypothetical protein
MYKTCVRVMYKTCVYVMYKTCVCVCVSCINHVCVMYKTCVVYVTYVTYAVCHVWNMCVSVSCTKHVWCNCGCDCAIFVCNIKLVPLNVNWIFCVTRQYRWLWVYNHQSLQFSMLGFESQWLLSMWVSLHNCWLCVSLHCCWLCECVSVSLGQYWLPV